MARSFHFAREFSVLKSTALKCEPTSFCSAMQQRGRSHRKNNHRYLGLGTLLVSTQYSLSGQIRVNNTLEAIYRSQDSQLIIIQRVVETISSNSRLREIQADLKVSHSLSVCTVTGVFAFDRSEERRLNIQTGKKKATQSLFILTQSIQKSNFLIGLAKQSFGKCLQKNVPLCQNHSWIKLKPITKIKIV